MKGKFHSSFDDLRRHSQKCQSLRNTIHSSRILSQHGVSRVMLELGVTPFLPRKDKNNRQKGAT